MYKIYADDTLIHYPRLYDDGYLVLNPAITQAPNTHGSMTFTMPPNHPCYDTIETRNTIIRVLDDTEELFRGRVIEVTRDFYNRKSIYCEGELAFLVDSYWRPFGFQGSPTELFTALIENHNSQVDEDRQFTVGKITVEDSNDYINRSSNTALSTWEAINTRLIDTLGGYIRTRLSGGVRYIDYLADFDSYSDQTIRFGENLLDIERYVSAAGIVTCLIPYGAEYEEGDENYTEKPDNGSYNGNRVGISSVNGGVDYVSSETGVALYGKIWGTNTWDDVTEPANLLTKAQAYVDAAILESTTLTIKAIDLHLIDVDTSRIHVGEYVKVYSKAHDVSVWLVCTEIALDLANPENTEITLGASQTTLTGSVSSGAFSSGSGGSGSSSGSNANLIALTARVDTIEGDYVTHAEITDLVANTVTVTELTARIATIENAYITTAQVETLLADNAYLNEAEIQSLIASYAYITTAEVETLLADKAYLTSADITTLTAKVANIETLLSGSAGVENLQAIHLSSANVVIADATITEAMIAELTASKITSGTLYTGKVRIANDSGENLLIDGSTLTIKDSNSTVRVQIGEDGQSDYNLYLWDAEGTLIWNAQGLTAEGLGGNGAIIKDMHVADDAAISGEKLNITSVAEKLNEDGSITVSAAQVTIDDTTLDVVYTDITDGISTLQTGLTVVQGQITAKVWQTDIETALLADTTNLISSGDFDGYSTFGTDCDWYRSASNYMVVTTMDEKSCLKITSSTSSTTYRYIRQGINAPAGTYRIQMSLACSNTSTCTLQVWLGTSITIGNAKYGGTIAEAGTIGTDWATYTMTVTLEEDCSYFFVQTPAQTVASIYVTGIELCSADTLLDAVTTITDKYAEITETLDGITAEVGELTTTTDSLSSSYSKLKLATDSLCMTVAESVIGTESNIIRSGTFEGYSNFGSSYDWKVSGTEDYFVGTLKNKSCIAIDTSEDSKVYLRQTLYDGEWGMYVFRMKLACSSEIVDTATVHVRTEDSGHITVAAPGELSTSWTTVSTTLECEPEEGDYLYIWLPAQAAGTIYITDIELYPATALTAYTSSQIELLKDSIKLQVTDGTGTASIQLVVGDTVSDTVTAVTSARTAFANESTAITISAGTVAFKSNTLVVNSSQLTLDSSGNATFSGALSAATGTFAGELTAATGTFAGELSAATGSFSGLVSMTSGMVYNALDVGGYLTIFKEYITNGSFTDDSYSVGTSKGDSYWYYNTSYTSATEYNGLNCLKTYSTSTTATNSLGYIRKYPTTAWESGVTYLVKAKIASASSTAIVRARFGSATSPSNGNYMDMNKAGELTEKWQNFSCLITTTSSYNYFYLNPIYSNSSDPVYITDIQVSRLDEPTGRIGYMAGATSYSDTDGIGLMHSDRANYVIATSAGTRIQAGNSSLYATEDGINLKVNGNQYTPYYTAGNSVTVYLNTAGYITNSGTYLYFTIPVTKPFVGVSTVTVDSIGVCVRQGNAYCYGSSADANVSPASATVTAGNVGFRVLCTFSNTTNVTNNSPAGVYVAMTVTLS